MKQIEKISAGASYTAVSVGRLNELEQHVLTLAPEIQIPGKVFLGQALAATGAEISFQSFPVGGQTGFHHIHKNHEELYICVSGKGEFQIDGQTFGFDEGSVVRIAPEARRTIRNTGDVPLVVICVQYKGQSFTAEDATDGIILNDPVAW